MEITVENVDSTKKTISVRIPSGKVAEKRNSVFQELMTEVKVKGFRKGKAPHRVIESMYGKEINQETASSLVSETLQEVLIDQSLSPVTRPDIIKMDEIELGKDFSYSAEFETVPEFELSDYSSIAVKKTIRQITEEDIDEELQGLTQRSAQLRLLETDRAAEKGDYLVVDYAGAFENGDTIDDLNKQNVGFILGEKHFFPEFEENLLGKKAGEEVEVSVSYPEDFLIPETAGKTIEFKVKLKEIHDRILPELNDDFAKDLGAENLSELRKKIKEQLQFRHDAEQLSSMRDQIVDGLLQNNQFDAPPSLVEKERENLKRGFISDMQAKGFQYTEVGEKAMPKFTEKATESVRTSIILEHIAKKEDIKVTPKQLSDQIESMAASYNLPRDAVYKAYEQKGAMEHLESRIKTQNVLDFLLEKAQIEEVAHESSPIDNKQPS